MVTHIFGGVFASCSVKGFFSFVCSYMIAIRKNSFDSFRYFCRSNFMFSTTSVTLNVFASGHILIMLVKISRKRT